MAKLTIKEREFAYGTYFRTSDVRPVLERATLYIVDGYGQRRSWGTPSVRTYVTRLSPRVVQVSVTGWHKHTVSPVGGNYYYVYESRKWTQRTANYGMVKSALAEANKENK